MEANSGPADGPAGPNTASMDNRRNFYVALLCNRRKWFIIITHTHGGGAALQGTGLHIRSNSGFSFMLKDVLTYEPEETEIRQPTLVLDDTTSLTAAASHSM